MCVVCGHRGVGVDASTVGYEFRVCAVLDHQSHSLRADFCSETVLVSPCSNAARRYWRLARGAENNIISSS